MGSAPGAGYLPRLMLSASLPEIACGGTRFPGFRKVMAVPWLEEVSSLGDAPGAGYLPRLMLSAALPEIALRRHPVPGAFVGGRVLCLGWREVSSLGDAP